MGVELYRSRELHITLPNRTEPKVRFPAVPQAFRSKLEDSSGREREGIESQSPPRLPLSTVVNRLHPQIPTIHLYVSSDLEGRWISEIVDSDKVERRDLGKITKRSVVTSSLACREIDNGDSESQLMDYKIERVTYTSPEEYLEDKLSSSK